MGTEQTHFPRPCDSQEMNKHADVIEERMVFLEGLCKLTPNQQQWLYRIMDRFEMSGEPPRPLYLIFSCYDYKRIIAKMTQRAHLLRIKKLCELDSFNVHLNSK